MLLMDAPRTAADVLSELVNQLFDVYSGAHGDLEHELLDQVFRQRVACVSTQVDRQDIEIAFGHRDIVSAKDCPSIWSAP